MKYLFYIILVFICACTPQQKINDIIDFHATDAGISDTVNVDELFFAQSYQIQLDDDGTLNAGYLKDRNQIVLNPDPDYHGLSFLHFENAGEPLVLPVKIKKKTKVTFSYTPQQAIESAYVMGNFNNWDRSEDAMTDENGDGTYEATILFDDGVYEYQFVVDQNEFPDPDNPLLVDNGYGAYNSLLRVKSQDKSQLPYLYFLNGTANSIRFAIHGDVSQNVKVHVLKDNILLDGDYITIENKIVGFDLNKIRSKDGLLRFVATSGNEPGNIVNVWLKDGKVDDGHNNFIWQDAIIYSLIVDRFLNGNEQNDDPVEHPELHERANFQGGDLEGVIRKIRSGYFSSLNINTIWISPVYETTDDAFREWPEPHRYFSGYHGYWPVSAERVEPRFGTIEQLKNLIDLAHHNGIKVLLDFVSNHTHQEHHYYQNHTEWFGEVNLPDGSKNIRRFDEYRLTTWFDTFLPSFDFLSSPQAVNAVTDNAVWWLKTTNADGFRHDATKHVPYVFWKDLTRKIKTQSDQNYYQIGETFGSYDLIKSYVNNGMLSAQFNFEQFFTARRIFAEEDGSFTDLKTSIEKALDVYGYHHIMGNIMDSHDQPRMLALLEGDLTLSENAAERGWHEPKIVVDNPVTYKKATVFMTYLLTVPGVPIIYYGDEFGMTGAADPDNRRMMRFDNELSKAEKNHLIKISELIKTRKNYSALRRGDFLPLHAEEDILIYSRGDAFERILVGLNKSKSPRIVNLKLPDWIAVSNPKKVFGNANARFDGSNVTFMMPPFSSLVYSVAN